MDSELIPIEGGDGIETQTSVTSRDSSQVNVFWSDPSHPVEVTQCLKDVVGEPEVDEHAAEAIQEITELAKLPSVGRSVVLIMESTIQRDCGQV